MKSVNLLAISNVTTLTIFYLMLMMVLLDGNKTVDAILSRFDQKTIDLIFNAIFSSKMFKALAVASVVTYIAGVALQLTSERRVSKMLVIATLTIPLALAFLVD